MTTPFSKERYDIADFRNAVSDIKSDIEQLRPIIDDTDISIALADIERDIVIVQPLIDKADVSSNVEVEMQMLISLSGLEIKMTNLTMSPKAKNQKELSDLLIKMSNFAEDMRRKLA